MRINFEGEITEESFNDFLEKISAAESNVDEFGYIKPIEFWISSEGGLTYYALAMLDILERLPVEMIAYGDLSSSAFILFTLFKGKKRMLREVQAMAHQGSYSIPIRADGSHSRYDKIVKTYRQKKERETFAEMNKIWKLTPKQKREYLSGKDVFIPNEQLQSIIDEQRKENTKRTY